MTSPDIIPIIALTLLFAGLVAALAQTALLMRRHIAASVRVRAGVRGRHVSSDAVNKQ